MKAIKKFFKFIFGLIVTIVVVAVLLVLTLPFWIGPVAKTAANRTVPGITGTDFRLGEFGFNFYTGKLRIGDIRLANPEGYSPKNALTLGRFNVDLDVGSLFEDTIVIHEIALRDVFVSYVAKDGKYNFDVIADNAKAALGTEETEEPEAPAPREQRKIEIEIPQPKEGEPAPEPAPGEGGEEAAQKKVVIDRIEISGISVQVQWCPIPLPVPTIVLRDIGRESGGIEWDDALSQIFQQILNKVNSLGQGLVNLGERFGDVATNSLNSISTSIVENSAVVTNMAAGVTSDVINTLTSTTTGAIDAVGNFKDSLLSAASIPSKPADEAAADEVPTEDENGTVGEPAPEDPGILKSTGDATMSALKATGDVATDAVKATGDTFKAAGKELKSVGKDIKNMFKKQ